MSRNYHATDEQRECKPLERISKMPEPIDLQKQRAKHRLYPKKKTDTDKPSDFINKPIPPNSLSKEALVEWNRLANELHSSYRLNETDKAAFATYCEAYARLNKAQVELERTGFTMELKNGRTIRHPLVNIVNETTEIVRKFSCQFGLTPVSRSKVREPKSSNWDIFDDFDDLDT